MIDLITWDTAAATAAVIALVASVFASGETRLYLAILSVLNFGLSGAFS